MLVVFPPIFVADIKIIYGYNFVAPLTWQTIKTNCKTIKLYPIDPELCPIFNILEKSPS